MYGYEWKKRDKFDGVEEEHYSTDFMFDRTIEFIERMVQKKRYFATMLSILDPHAPQQVREPYYSMYNHFKFKYPKTGKVALSRKIALPVWTWSYDDVYPVHSDEMIEELENDPTWQSHMSLYFGMVKCIDDNLGKLLQKLKELGIEDNTVVIFTR